MTVKNHFFRRLASDKRILVCAGLLFSMTMTSGFISNRPVSIAVDGHTIELNTPYRTPANILSQAGVTIQDKDECLLTSDDDGNTVLTVNRAVPVVFNIDGKKEEAKTCKPTVGEAVESFGYVGNGYQTELAAETAVEAGMEIIVKTVPVKPVVQTERGAVQYDKCITMEASAYLPSDGGGSGITATGAIARHGIVAVDPRVIPLGTKVFIPGYGIAVAADTGGAIKGQRIDLCMESYHDAIQFGRRDISVYVLG